MRHVLLAQTHEAYAPPLFTLGDVVRFTLVLLLALALLVLVVNSWRVCGLLTEIRNLLRQGRGESPGRGDRPGQ